MQTPAALIEGEMEILGQLPASSNYTFLARLNGGENGLVVYKPQKGESPLWDFPAGTLCQREVAAHVVCRAAGWDFVPPTVLRDGPFGLGAVQSFVEHDPADHAFNLAAEHPDDLRRIALFDLVVNNADRKAGHVLKDPQGGLWAIDHGVCFHAEPKLRTVLWDFIGEPIPPPALEAVRRLGREVAGEAGGELQDLLLPEEIDCLQERAASLLEEGLFPAPGAGRPYPWPPI